MTRELNKTVELKYRDAVMDRNPDGMLLREVADYLADDRPVRLRLQPGDATRYELLLVPVRRDRGLLREPTVDFSWRWIWFFYLHDGRGCRLGRLLPLNGTVGEHEFAESGKIGVWERELFAWWVNELAGEIRRV